jgi:RNA polymerase primary sigma factor
MPRITLNKTLRSPTAINPYMAEVHRIPLLSVSEEKELAARILVGDAEARDKMVRAHLRLVVNIARGYACKGMSMEDLVSEGNLGLMRAVEGFDPMMNTRFSTYASFWIKQSIKRGIVNTGKSIRIPNYLTQLIAEWRRITIELTDELQRPPTRAEVAGIMGLSRKTLKVITEGSRISYAQQSDREVDGPDIIETLMDKRATLPGAVIDDADDLGWILQLLDKMDRREAKVLRLRFGFGGGEPRTLKQIGESLGLTRERIRQIEGEALVKLRTEIQAN